MLKEESSRQGDREAPSEEEAIAYHEAGHAVAHCVTGVPLVCVTIDSEVDGEAGYCLGADLNETGPEAGLLIAFAGPASGVLASGLGTVALLQGEWSAEVGRHQRASRGDFEKANAILVAAGVDASERRAWIERSMERAIELTNDWSGAIGSVANALLEKRRVTGNEVIRIMNQVGRSAGRE